MFNLVFFVFGAPFSRPLESFSTLLTAGLLLVVSLMASKRVLRVIETAARERVLMEVSRSSTTIWWVSLSVSLERDVKILCLISTMAR